MRTSRAPFAHSGLALIHAVVLQPFEQSVQIVSTASGLSHGPRLEPVVARRDRADRADVHQVAGEQRVDAALLERRDLAAVPAVDDADLRVAVDLLHEPDAPRAEDAAVAVEHQRRAEVDVRLHALAVEHAARELHPALARAEGVREVLQRALAALVADGAVERMVDEQELEDAGAGVDHVGGPREDTMPSCRWSSTTSAASASSRS
jgi:hypothetical protein